MRQPKKNKPLTKQELERMREANPDGFQVVTSSPTRKQRRAAQRAFKKMLNNQKKR